MEALTLNKPFALRQMPLIFMQNTIFFFTFLLIIVSCKNKNADKKEADPKNIYRDYRVWGEEGRDEATLRLQYKKGDEEGDAIALEAPAKVLFDDAEIKADSSHFTGPYYELVKPIDEFSGSHNILYVDPVGKEHRDSFRFEPFSLVEEIPERLTRKSFQLKLANFPGTSTLIRLVMADTSLSSEGVNEEMRIENGIVNITEQELAKLSNGPVILEIYREEEKPIQGSSGKSGKLSMTYGIKREFELTD